MIARTWQATADDAGRVEYRRHFLGTVVPHLQGIAGFEAAYLLERQRDGAWTLTVLSLWHSWDAIEAFAGADASVAVVEDAAKAVLTTSDERVVHQTATPWTATSSSA